MASTLKLYLYSAVNFNLLPASLELLSVGELPMFGLEDWANSRQTSTTEIADEQEQEPLNNIQFQEQQRLVEPRVVYELKTAKKLNRCQLLNGSQAEQERDQTLSSYQLISQAVLQMIDTAVIAIDGTGNILFLNVLAENLTGWSTHDAQSLPLSQVFKTVQRVTLNCSHSPVKEISFERKTSRFSEEALLISSEQRLISIEYFVSQILDTKNLLGTVLLFRPKSNLSKITSYTFEQLERDSLTGLANRSAFENDLEQILYETKTLEQDCILCYLDLDRFKIINEVCGHFAGDEFLRQFSTMLQKRIRKTDVLARLGGDEFALILRQCSLQQALGVLQALQEEVRGFRFYWQTHTFNFTFSAGITLLCSDSGSSSDVLIEADSACAIAKGRGRDRIQVYQANDQDLVIQRGDRKGVVRVIKALEQDDFLLYCQPIVPTIETDRAASQQYYEVLLRMQDEQGNLISPSGFLPAAERYGLMHLVDRWVIRNLFQRLNRKHSLTARNESDQSTNQPLPYCCYSINLSGSSFNDDQFLEFVQEQFNLYAVPPELICFEITETVAIANLGKAAQFINQLRKLGCQFALDDFGSGMSSFGYLKSLPVDYIKIDGNFIKEITENSLAYEIVKSINSIGHAMDIKTTAEFVENEAILTTLRMIGVDYVQGYGIAKPFPLQLF
ncbi:EAL domain-containing protein [Pantanalinema sp. GBBB05]|uniref:EAL domain-containing protein n=1 Tax=Pantanalinema sp. GBBB05 TaxID=2604139 RepID=UPI003D817EFC